MVTDKKEIDAVKLMRDIRENLARKYQKNPAKEIEDLMNIRKKYLIHSTSALSKTE